MAVTHNPTELSCDSDGGFSYHSSGDEDDNSTPEEGPKESPHVLATNNQRKRKSKNAIPQQSSRVLPRRSRRSMKPRRNHHILSKVHTEFLKNHSEIIVPIKRIIRSILKSDTRLPSEPGNGIVLKTEAAYNPKNLQINVKRSIPIKELYGARANAGEVEDEQDTMQLHAYSTGSGNVTTGTRKRFAFF